MCNVYMFNITKYTLCRYDVSRKTDVIGPFDNLYCITLISCRLGHYVIEIYTCMFAGITRKVPRYLGDNYSDHHDI